GGLDSTNPATPTATADIYDPVTGTWTPAASMGTARYAAAAVLLPNGRVLVAGGDQGSPAFNALASAEVYDPATDTWSAAASMSHARAWLTATVLGNGKVVVAGGAGNDFFGFPPQAAVRPHDRHLVLRGLVEHGARGG